MSRFIRKKYYIHNHRATIVCCLLTVLISCDIDFFSSDSGCDKDSENRGEILYTVENEVDFSFRIEPNEKRLLYSTSNYGKTNYIYKVDIQQKQKQLIVSESGAIIFIGVNWNENILFYLSPDGFIKRVNLSNNNVENLCSSVSMAIISGDEIAFTKDDDNIYIYNITNATEKRICQGYIKAFSSSAGRLYATKYADNGDYLFFQYDIQSMQESIIDNPGIDVFFYSNWDNKDFYIYSPGYNTVKTYIVTQNTTDYQHILYECFYAVSSSGKYFVYVKMSESKECKTSPKASIYVLDTETNTEHEVAFEYNYLPSQNVSAYLNESSKTLYYKEMYSPWIFKCKF